MTETEKEYRLIGAVMQSPALHIYIYMCKYEEQKTFQGQASVVLRLPLRTSEVFGHYQEMPAIPLQDHIGTIVSTPNIPVNNPYNSPLYNPLYKPPLRSLDYSAR